MFDMQKCPPCRGDDVNKPVAAGDGRQKLNYSAPVFRTYGLVSKLTMGGGSIDVDGINTTMMSSSDRRLKENIIRVDTHPLGIGLYLFDYKPEYREHGGSGRQFGVMADEVEMVMPEAVCVRPDGYKMVNYAMLGIRHRIQ